MKEQEIIPLPDIHVALISPPCQGFSSANPGGKNDDENRDLLGSVRDIARSFEPYWICVENVPGCAFTSWTLAAEYFLIISRLFRATHRAHLCRMEIDLISMGYSVSVAEQCSSNFGVPQTRRRLILFAARRDLAIPEFPSITHAWDSPDHLPIVSLRSAIGDLNHDNPRPDNDEGNPEYIRPASDPVCDTEYTKMLGSDRLNQITHHATGYRSSSEKTKEWPTAEWDEPSCTVRTMPGSRWRCVHPGNSLF